MAAIPDGYGSVTPWIISKDTVRVLEFVKEAFGAEEIGRVALDDGSIGHAEVRIGDSVVMMFDARADWAETPCFLRLYVEDADTVFQRAVRAGGSPVTEMTTLFFGDRVGRVRDPLGNLWWIQERIEDLTEDEIAVRAGQEEYAAAMEYVKGGRIVE